MTQVHDYLRRRNMLFRNPTVEGAMNMWNWKVLGPPKSPEVALAGVHKARLMWTKATPAMVEQSLAWLKDHGYLP